MINFKILTPVEILIGSVCVSVRGKWRPGVLGLGLPTQQTPHPSTGERVARAEGLGTGLAPGNGARPWARAAAGWWGPGRCLSQKSRLGGPRAGAHRCSASTAGSLSNSKTTLTHFQKPVTHFPPLRVGSDTPQAIKQPCGWGVMAHSPTAWVSRVPVGVLMGCCWV